MKCDELTYEELTDRTHTRIVSFIVLDGWIGTVDTKHTECPHLVSVVTLPLARVEDEAASAGLGVRHSVRTEVELVANCLVRVSEVTVGSGTAGTGLGGLEILPA